MFTKTSLMRTGGVLGATAALIGIGLSPAAAIDDGSATANASTLTGTGLFESIAPLLQQGDCTATFADGGPEAKVGACTPSIELEPAQAVVRYATANVSETDGAATSAAYSSVADVPITDLPAELNLTNILADLAATPDSASALGPLLSGVGELVLELLAPLTTQLDAALGELLAQVQATLPLSINVGAIVATCEADGTTATAGSDVASVDILVDLTGLAPELGVVAVPMTLATTANADLIADVGQLVDGIIDGLEATLTESLGGLLADVAELLNVVQTQVVDALLAQLKPALLQPLSDALASILSVKLNVTPDVATGTAQPFTAPEQIDLTAIQLTLLGSNTLSIGHVHCGDNTDGTVHTPPPSETPDVPTVIDSGLTGGSFGGAGVIAAMMVVGAAVGVAGHRLTRSLS